MSRAALMAYITANAKDFHATMARVRADGKATGTATGRDFAAMSARIRGIGGAVAAGIRGGPTGIAAALGLGIVADQAAKAVRHVEELAAAAKTAGVDFEAFQELRYAAERNLVSVDALTDGLKEMQLRIDEVIKSGKGPAAESLGRLGYTAEDLARKLKQPDKLFEEIIGRLKTLDKAAQIRVADEIFGGTAGEQFLRLLDDARGSIEENRKAARDLDQVISNEMRESVDELKSAWDRIGSAIGGKVTKAVTTLLALLGNALDRYDEIEQMSLRNLNVTQIETDKRRTELENEIKRIENEPDDGDLWKSAEEVARIKSAKLAALNEEYAKLTEISERAAIATSKKIAERDKEDVVEPEDTGLGDPPARDKAAEAAARERKAILELMVTLEDEYNLIGASEADRRVNVELRKLSTEAVEEYGAALEQMIRRNIEANAAHERANELMEEQRELAERFQEDVVSNLEGVISKAQSVEEALINIGFAALRSLLDVQKLGGGLNQVGSGGGGLLGFLGKLLGGGGGQLGIAKAGGIGLYAKGTDYAPGGLAIVGERGPELVNLPRGSKVFSNAETTAMLSGSDGRIDQLLNAFSIGGEPMKQAEASVSVVYAPVYNVEGKGEEIEALRAQMARDRAELPGVIIGSVKDAQKRRVI